MLSPDLLHILTTLGVSDEIFLDLDLSALGNLLGSSKSIYNRVYNDKRLINRLFLKHFRAGSLYYSSNHFNTLEPEQIHANLKAIIKYGNLRFDFNNFSGTETSYALENLMPIKVFLNFIAFCVRENAYLMLQMFFSDESITNFIPVLFSLNLFLPINPENIKKYIELKNGETDEDHLSFANWILEGNLTLDAIIECINFNDAEEAIIQSICNYFDYLFRRFVLLKDFTSIKFLHEKFLSVSYHTENKSDFYKKLCTYYLWATIRYNSTFFELVVECGADEAQFIEFEEANIFKPDLFLRWGNLYTQSLIHKNTNLEKFLYLKGAEFRRVNGNLRFLDDIFTYLKSKNIPTNDFILPYYLIDEMSSTTNDELDGGILHKFVLKFIRNEIVSDNFFLFILNNFKHTLTLLDRDGRTPLHRAVRWIENTKIINEKFIATHLLLAMPNCCSTIDATGKSPLHLAVIHKKSELLHQLLAELKNLTNDVDFIEVISIKGSSQIDYNTPLHLALIELAKHTEDAELLDMADLLIKCNAKLIILSNYQTPLSLFNSLPDSLQSQFSAESQMKIQAARNSRKYKHASPGTSSFANDQAFFPPSNMNTDSTGNDHHSTYNIDIEDLEDTDSENDLTSL